MAEPVEGRPASSEGDIDQRMAALLKDHQEMGARPLQEPTSDDVPALPKPMTSGAAKAPKGTRGRKSK